MCYHRFENKQEPRVNTWGVFVPANSTGYLGKISVCATDSCLQEVREAKGI